jgi:hypothetical protein
MARRQIPALVVEAAAAHVRDVHGIEKFDPGQIGVPSSRSARTIVTWNRNGSAGGAWFNCRLCPLGFNRLTAELDASEPTPRIAELIRLHLATHAGEPVEDYAYVPLTAAQGAGISCPACTTVGRDPVYLTDPPIGDARRLRYLLRTRPGLRSRVAGMSTLEQSLYIEAHDRRSTGRHELGVPRPALRRANRMARAPRAGCLDKTLLRMLLAEPVCDRGITSIISELDTLAVEDPESFCCRLGRHVPELAPLGDTLSRESFVQRIAEHFDYPEGRLPVARETGLWRVWSSRGDGASHHRGD